MGWGAAANAQNQATQMAMLAQAQQAQQAQQALQQGQSQAASALQQGMQAYQPYQTAGTGATNQLAALFAPGGAYTQMPTMSELQMDPSYAFRMAEGLKAIERSAAARAGLQSGAALKAAQRFGQDFASNEYQNAYNRFMANRAAATQGLQNLSAGGLTAAGGIGNVGANLANVYTGTGQQLAQNYMGLGQALGQGYANIGAANASSYMAPTNLLASALGQGAQLGAMYLGGGFGKPAFGGSV